MQSNRITDETDIDVEKQQQLQSSTNTCRDNRSTTPVPPRHYIRHNDRRRLKGLLALLPETGTLYPYQSDVTDGGGEGNNNSNGNVSIRTSTFISTTTKTRITSRKQQKRQLKRYLQQQVQQQAVEKRSNNDEGSKSEDIESNSHQMINKVGVHLLDDILNSPTDLVALFMFDPYQSYSIQLLHTYIEISKISCHQYNSCISKTDLSSDVTVNNNNDFHEQNDNVNTKLTVTTTIINDCDKNNINNDSSSSLSSLQPSKLHCLAVTSCTDEIMIDQLLLHSGIILLPWTSNNESWKVVLGGQLLLCPSILGIIECQYGRNIFPMECEEMALSSNSSSSSISSTASHIYDCWFHQRKSALSILQRIQTYIPFYPTSSSSASSSSSICAIQ